MRQEFWIETIPQGQRRPRFARIGQGVRTYDDSKSVSYKDDIRQQILSKPHSLMTGPVSMILEFRMVRPKAHYGKHGLKPNRPFYCTTKPDLDNLVKAVKDAMKGVILLDDNIVCELKANKTYAECPGINIVVADAEGVAV